MNKAQLERAARIYSVMSGEDPDKPITGGVLTWHEFFLRHTIQPHIETTSKPNFHKVESAIAQALKEIPSDPAIPVPGVNE